ncbi:hypothetical protein YC2023_005975 [Brassica napus]
MLNHLKRKLERFESYSITENRARVSIPHKRLRECEIRSSIQKGNHLVSPSAIDTRENDRFSEPYRTRVNISLDYEQN